MLGLDMLDVAIGVVFVFLLVSLIASAIAEYIENLLKKRASDLEKGILEMLKSDQSLMQELYEHPLIASLYEGKTHKEAKEAGTLPSYIPARSFALAMMDIVLSTDQKSGTAGATPQATMTMTSTVQGGTNTEVVENAAKIESVSAEVMTELRKAATKDTSNTRTVQERLANLPADVAKTLVTFVDAAGGDAAKVRTNIEGWFNASMDRVSGWYKRRNHQILVGIGLVLAILFNIDTISIVQSLWTNKGMRDAGVAAAGAFAAKDPALSTVAPEQKIRDYSKSLNTLKLPIGWEAEVETWPKGTNVIYAAVAAVPPHLIGWIITAAAVSMGAPFWFDTLNRIMVVRSTVKPHEKSAEEAPKERTAAVS